MHTKFKTSFMLIKRSVFILFLVFLILSKSYAYDSPTDSKLFKNIWEDFSSISNEAIELATDSKKRSKSALEFITAREPKYIRLLKKAQNVLSTSETSEYFNNIDELYLKNKELEKDFVELKRSRIAAPESSYNPFTYTKSKIDKKLKEIPVEISNNKEAIKALQNKIIEILKKKGLKITNEELNYLIISAEGSELVRLMNIAENIKRIQYIIEKEMQNNRNNIELAKYYAGMYLICLEAYSTSHDIALEKIASYKGKLKKIVKEADENYENAKKLARTANSSERKILDANIKINDQVIRVGGLYNELLDKRKIRLKQSRNKLQGKIELAMNTYKTILNGSSLISLVNETSNEFSLIANFEVPEFRVIYDSALLNAFIDISDKIRKED